jgi:hypothetical protein
VTAIYRRTKPGAGGRDSTKSNGVNYLKSPLLAFSDWFMSLPPAHKDEIAAFIVVSGPQYAGSEFNPDTAEPILLEELSKYRNERMRETGLALALRETVDLFVLNHKGNRESWNISNNRNLQIKAKLKQSGEHPKLQKVLYEMNTEMPLNREQWLVTAEKWNVLKNTDLSNDNLDAWWKPSYAQSPLL